MSSVAFSVSLPNCKEGKAHPPGTVNVSWMRAVAESAEEFGFDGLWANELLQTQIEVSAPSRVMDAPPDTPPNYFDPLAALAYVAAITERVRLTTATIILPQHHPVPLSRQIATLDNFSGGRVTLGVGLGGSFDSFRQLRGELGSARRGDLMDEYLTALRLQWEQGRATFEGQYVSFQDAEAFPKPVQVPLPIFVAGGSDAALMRVARFGQGWIDSHTLPEGIPLIVEKIQAFRGPGLGLEVDVSRQFYMSLADTREGANEILARSLGAANHAVTDPENRRIIGTPDDFVRVLLPFIGAGVTEICCIFYGDTIESVIKQTKLFASEVRPALVERSLELGKSQTSRQLRKEKVIG